MELRPLNFVAAACEGELLGGRPETMVSRVATDSRQVQTGDLFVALTGEKFDAHDYLSNVVGQGASALVLTERGWRKRPTFRTRLPELW